MRDTFLLNKSNLRFETVLHVRLRHETVFQFTVGLTKVEIRDDRECEN